MDWGLGIVDWGLWIGDCGLGIGDWDWVNANNTEFTFFFPFHSKIINIFFEKMEKEGKSGRSFL